ncbi:Stringent starvation protein B [Thioalkalivibrio nitratireducens DSM 14787]|uniref:Stringent starvation protein B n=1 Tax=Thioalkalivibrio nitratireducens (strain DSM 14787 / UNIQEM 213 / ALEN2) TaxID=1255043 RepID=L0DXD7_THIND|nr:ClpXP protease specificity-enhancing factor [Thioalkalivibrio nitratireducens]AGA34259.1 Stringent starvation protein B [Thioalkalivibrio nitratireducens DSM 14787]
MTPSRPYLVRALLDWIVDNSMTPHLLVDATRPGVTVPEQFVQDGKITLNIGPAAVQALQLDNDAISFSARFAGRPMQVYLPMGSVLAIFARENGQGMMFGNEPGSELQPESESADDAGPGETADAKSRPTRPRKGPSLKVVK